MSPPRLCSECRAILPDSDRATALALCPGCLVTLALDADPDELPPGDSIPFGDYELLNEIASGGMGVVFRARQISINRLVALKTIRAGRLAGTAERRRFQNEAEAAAKLDHPGIVPVYDVGECEGQQFLSMKLIEGPSLAQQMAVGRFRLDSKENPVAQQRAIARLMSGVARAVHHAHERGILHRDLKPSNILMDARDEPHLTDFGLAKLIEGHNDLTRTAAILGTVDYMSPEQAGGNSREATVSTDIYSLGVILFELLTGRTPFGGPDPLEVLRRAAEEEPPPPRSLQAAVNRDLETICLKCLEKTPSNRYASALTLAEDLERWLSNQPILARPSSAWERLIKFGQRRPLVAAILAILTLAIVSVSSVGYYALRQKDDAITARKEAFRTAGRLQIQQTRDLFESENSVTALAKLARIVREQPANLAAASRLMAALTQRPFAFPLAALSHDAEVRSAVYSPNGLQVLTACDDGAARVWDATTGRLLQTLAPSAPTSSILAASYTRDGTRIATASRGGAAQVWDPENGRSLVSLPHSSWVRAVEFSPDGHRLLTLSTNRVIAWDLRTVSPVTLPVSGERARVARWTPDGQRIVAGSEDGTIFIWDGSTGRELRRLRGHLAAVRCLVITDDGRQLVSGSDDGSIRVTQLDRLDAESLVLSHAGPVTSLALHPEQPWLASTSADGSARFWDLSNGRPMGEPMRHSGPVTEVAIRTDGRFFLTACDDGFARLWRTADNQPASEPVPHPDFVDGARFKPDGGGFLTVCSDRVVRLWRTPQPQQVYAPLADLNPDVSQFEYDGERRWALVVSNEVVTGLDFETGQRIEVATETTGLRKVALSQTGGRLLLVTAHEVQLTTLGQPGIKVLPQTEEVRLARFSQDSTRVATTTKANVSVWSSISGQRLFRSEGHDPIQDLALSSNGTRVAVLTTNTAWVWEPGNGSARPATLVHNAGTLDRLILSSDGKHLAISGHDGSVHVWDLVRRRPWTLQLGGPVRSIDLSADGGALLTASGRTATVWDVRRQVARVELHHGSEVNSARFSPEGRRIVTGSADQSMQVWDFETGQMITDPIPTGAPVWDVAFTLCGRWIAGRTVSSPVYWEVPDASDPAPRWLSELGEAIAGARWEQTGVAAPLPGNALFDLKEKLLEESGNDAYLRWVRWLLAAAPDRPCSPSTTAQPPAARSH